MKIKAVCEATGLSDRTIRYYIEEGLISPKYTENYLGRKTFDFTQENVVELKNIATLRSFDFSVEEIRSIIQDSTKSLAIIESVKRRIQTVVSDGERKLDVLMRLDTGTEYTIADLAGRLSEISSETPPKNEEIKWDLRKTIWSVSKAVLTFTIVWFPVALTIFVLLQVRIRRYYPVYDPKGILCLLLCLLPSFLTVIISKFRFAWRKIVKAVLLILCILSIPYCALFSMCEVIVMSETSDVSDYRDFDVECGLNTNIYFDELFPKYAHAYEVEIGEYGKQKNVKVDAKYYYRYIEDFDSSCDVYAEWPLNEEAFYEEVSRVEAVFRQFDSEDEEFDVYTYEVIQKGKYTCFLFYDIWGSDKPFNAVTGSYYYLIFAYDEENLRVRYIYSQSLQDGTVQPYYLDLDW